MDALKKEEIVGVIEGKGAAKRGPLIYDLWIYGNLFENGGERKKGREG